MSLFFGTPILQKKTEIPIKKESLGGSRYLYIYNIHTADGSEIRNNHRLDVLETRRKWDKQKPTSVGWSPEKKKSPENISRCS